MSEPSTLLPKRSVRIDAECIACGYNLRGTDVAAGCPECGTPIQTSLSHARRLTRRDLTALVLRLLAVVLIVLYAPHLFSLALGEAHRYFFSYSSSFGSSWVIYEALYYLVLLVLSGLIWAFAGTVATLIFPDNALITMSGRLDRRALVHIGLILVGAYFTIDGGAGAMHWFIYDALIGRDSEWTDYYGGTRDYFPIAAFCRLVFGGLLLWHSWKIAGWLGQVGRRRPL